MASMTPEQIGYAIGMQNALQIKESLPDMDIDGYVKGFRDAFEGKASMSQAEVQQAMQEAQAQAQAAADEQAAGQIEASQALMARYAEGDGISKTESGLLYQILEAGNDTKPEASNTVEVHYRGTLPTGEEFDSSYKRNESISFGLTGVIKGWTEGLQLIGEGGKIKLWIPPELGYGAQGAGGMIKPHQVLLFDVELIKVS